MNTYISSPPLSSSKTNKRLEYTAHTNIIIHIHAHIHMLTNIHTDVYIFICLHIHLLTNPTPICTGTHTHTHTVL